MAITSRRVLCRGSALLTVMWISAALAAIGFALANTVRGETERTATTVDELRAYYLATGAIDRAAIEVLWSTVQVNDRRVARFSTGTDYDFLTGRVHVEFLPEAGKLDVNRVTPEQLGRLLEALGASPDRISSIVEGVVGWREGRGSSFSSLDGSTFPAAGTSFQEIEEMLAVRGVTPELFYGTYTPAPDGAAGGPRLIRHGGLVDCLSVFGSRDGQVDANTADPAVLHALGMPDSGIQALVAQRSAAPLDMGKLNDMMPLFGPAAPFLRLEGHSILTIRATAMVRLPSGGYSDLKRTVAAMVKYMPQGYDSPIHILRWYDTAWSN
jgi:general secretion pathway protein K